MTVLQSVPWSLLGDFLKKGEYGLCEGRGDYDKERPPCAWNTAAQVKWSGISNQFMSGDLKQWLTYTHYRPTVPLRGCTDIL